MDEKHSYVLPKHQAADGERIVQGPRHGENIEIKRSNNDGSMPLTDLAKLSKLATKMSRSLPLPPQQNLSRVVSKRLAVLQKQKHVLVWNDRGPITMIIPSAESSMQRAKLMQMHAVKLVEAIRCSAQPNKAYRHKRLVPSDVGALGERVELILELRSFRNCFDNIPPFAQYYADMSASHTKIATYHDTFLRQVMKYSVKPLQDFAEVAYPQMVTAYESLVKHRNKYDKARSNQHKVDEQRATLTQQASVVEEMLRKIPEHQISIAKAIDTYARAEAHFFRQTRAAWMTTRPPDNKKRWMELVE